MTASQTNAKDFNPNKLKLTKVASYERTIYATIERAWENVLDWAHLPHLHDTSFNFVELDTAGAWGWRTWSNAEHSDHIELTLSDDSRYVARTYQAGHQVSEIWTTLTADGDNTAIKVDFHLPDIKPEAAPKLGKLMTKLYTQLWDEDEGMMQERHWRLNESRNNAVALDLGSIDALKAQLSQNEAITFQLERREYQLRWHENSFKVLPTICPHLLGPLKDADLAQGTVRCPWHGYVFNIETGNCVVPANSACHLPKSPHLTEQNNRIIASFK